jgi:hypothetical protein
MSTVERAPATVDDVTGLKKSPGPQLLLTMFVRSVPEPAMMPVRIAFT